MKTPFNNFFTRSPTSKIIFILYIMTFVESIKLQVFRIIRLTLLMMNLKDCIWVKCYVFFHILLVFYSFYSVKYIESI